MLPIPRPGFPVSFGRYLLLEKIASGGMAEVFRAVLLGAAGFEKPLAVKRILPIFNEEPDFIALFQDEARIASTLAHANIAQVFEFGEVDGSSFIALELVDGLDLGRVTQRLRAAGQPMPLATAAFIVAEAARGLAYAHERRGADGRLINIVHRDVSPPNILISLAGEIKVADFGIAKAANKVHKTETGVVMGKLRYMSPEQVAGEPLDARSDIFSLGVILYELLCGGPIYPGDQSFRLAELIRTEAPPPPSSRNPDVPAVLDAIVLRALAKRRDDRYQRAGDLSRDLAYFVSTHAPGFSREDLGALVASLVPPRVTIDATVPTDLAHAPPQATQVARATPATPARATDDEPRQLDVETRSLHGPPPSSGPKKKRLGTAALIGIVLAVVILGSGALVFVRFVLPGRDSARPDAAHVLTPAPTRADAGPALPEPPPTGAFTLVPTATGEARSSLFAAVDRFDVTRRGHATADYTAYLTGLDTGLGQLTVDENGKALPLEPLPPTVQALVQRAGVADAVSVTLETVRQTGELPPNVRSAARSFLAGRVAVLASEAVSAGERVPAFAAPGLAVWLEPQNRARLADLAFANDVLGRWCTPATSGRHFAPHLCEPAALIAALRAANARDPTAEALERAAQASDEIALGDGKVKVASADWADTSRPDERDLRVTLTAEGTAAPDATAVTLLASGVPATAGHAAEDAAGTLVWRVPIRLIAPVLSIDGKLLRLPPAPFSR